MKYTCIARYRGSFPVTLMCRVLGVSRSGFYAAQRRRPSARAREDQRLGVAIGAIHRASKRRYGSPRVYRELRAQGQRCGEKRVARLMQAAGLRAKKRRRFRVTTQSDHAYAPAPNVVARQFGVGRSQGERVWAADLTYLPTREGWLYLAVILELATRRVVGWAVRILGQAGALPRARVCGRGALQLDRDRHWFARTRRGRHLPPRGVRSGSHRRRITPRPQCGCGIDQ